MSEEFTLSVTFEMNTIEQMEEFETLNEYLELYDMDEARELLEHYKLAKAQGLIDEVTPPCSSYGNDDDLLDMYTATYNENVEDVSVSIEPSQMKACLHAEGHDRDANSFCAAQILILMAMGAKNINASASSEYWHSTWLSDENNHFNCIFEVEDV